MTIAVDFDGTIVEHRYPEIGEEKPFAVQKRGIEFYAINRDYPEETESGNEHYNWRMCKSLISKKNQT